MLIKAIFTYLTIVIIGSVTASIEMDFGSCSTHLIYEINEDKSYHVSWEGHSISTYDCKIGFNPYNTNSPQNKYKVCITASYWDIQKTEVKLNYYSTPFDVLEKTYSYYSSDNPTTEWCSDASQYIDIGLITSTSSEYQGSFGLVVTGVKTYDYYHVFRWTVGGAVGGAVVLVFAIILIVALACRRRRSSPSKPEDIFIHPKSRQMRGGYADPGYGTGQFQGPPSYQEVTNNSYPAPVHKEYQPQPSYQQNSSSESTQQSSKK